MSNIKITLCSDLCTASGEGYSSIIDTDVCFDDTGIPYIPSRRLKGVLRKAAELIDVDKETMDKIFGVRGGQAGGSLQLENAFLFDEEITYGEIQKELKGFPKEKVSNLFTYTRAATAIEAKTGSAKEDSLRFTRVIKQYSPKNEKPMVFSANCTMESQYNEILSRICKALRSIGYRRNRGFGAIRCIFESGTEENSEGFQIPTLQNEIKYEIPIVVTNTAPLIISSSKDDETENFISGTALLGAFAWRYPEKDSEAFQNLFLNKDVIFSNLYIGGKPVPLTYAKLKNAGTYINRAIVEESEILEKDTPKPLKDKYMDKEGYLTEVKKEIIYHYRTKNPTPQLYMQMALSVGQNFKGSIQGTGRDLSEILKLIKKDAALRIGKSKTAQYANCNITIGEAKAVSAEKLEVKDSTIAIYLFSDVILFEDGVNSCDYRDLIKAFNIPGLNTKEICEKSCDEEKTIVMFKTVTGYSGIWNMKKPHYKAFKAGSILFLKHVTAALDRDYYIGGKINEGFGHCQVMLPQEMPSVRKCSTQSINTKKIGSYAELIEITEKNNERMKQALQYAKDNKNKLPSSVITDSQIGRIRLMLKQSKNKNDFRNRVESIKSSAVRETFCDYFDFDDLRREPVLYENYEQYRYYWDTVLRWCRYQRKIDERYIKEGK